MADDLLIDNVLLSQFRRKFLVGVTSDKNNIKRKEQDYGTKDSIIRENIYNPLFEHLIETE